MRMSMNEKKGLYAFGCLNRESTVERLRYVAAIATDPATNKYCPDSLCVQIKERDYE